MNVDLGIKLAELIIYLFISMIGVGGLVGGIIGAFVKKGIMKAIEEKGFLTTSNFEEKCSERQGACSGKICIKLDVVKKDITLIREDVTNIYQSQEQFTYFMGQVQQFIEDERNHKSRQHDIKIKER